MTVTAQACDLSDLSDLFARARDRDRAARNELLTRLYDRIVRLTAVVLRSFPAVRVRREVESVANDLALKLIAALDEGLATRTTADFFRFAGTRLRHLLIDEADKFRRRENGRRRVLPLGGVDGPADDGHEFEPGTDTFDPAVIAEHADFWDRFHRRVGVLPPEEVLVVELHFLLQMPQAEVARVLGWEPKRVSRKWLAAAVKLADGLPERN